jgi:hypothetical protein
MVHIIYIITRKTYHWSGSKEYIPPSFFVFVFVFLLFSSSIFRKCFHYSLGPFAQIKAKNHDNVVNIVLFLTIVSLSAPHTVLE